MNDHHVHRRHFLKVGAAALAIMPILVRSRGALAGTNASMRSALKYQNKPSGDKNCASCMQFVPGASAKDLGSCKAIPGDTEISPQGYCIAWVKKA